MKGQKVEKQANKSKLRYVKIAGVLLVLIIAYAISVYTSSFNQTNIKLLSLVLYTVCGFLGFYLIYFVFYLITLVSYNKRVKKIANTVVSCDDNVALLFSRGKRFRYDVKESFTSNINNYKTAVLDVVEEVATGYGAKKGNYYYLNYTVYDAIDVVNNAIDAIDGKVSPIFKLLRAEDKPLKVVEKLLVSAIENENREQEVIEKKPSLISAVINKAKTVGTFIIKGAIDNAFNDLLVFICYEAFKVYGKDGAEYLPAGKEGEENA